MKKKEKKAQTKTEEEKEEEEEEEDGCAGHLASKFDVLQMMEEDA